MGWHKAKFDCPECDKEHTVDFSYWQPDDGDEITESVVCDCGCEFDTTVEVEVDIDFIAMHPEITKSGIKKPEFDINDTSTWPQENNPNQLTIL